MSKDFYKNLLIKYMANVIDNEGMSYIGRTYNIHFSEKESFELEEIAKEANCLLTSTEKS